MAEMKSYFVKLNDGNAIQINAEYMEVDHNKTLRFGIIDELEIAMVNDWHYCCEQNKINLMVKRDEK